MFNNATKYYFDNFLVQSGCRVKARSYQKFNIFKRCAENSTDSERTHKASATTPKRFVKLFSEASEKELIIFNPGALPRPLEKSSDRPSYIRIKTLVYPPEKLSKMKEKDRKERTTVVYTSIYLGSRTPAPSQAL